MLALVKVSLECHRSTGVGHLLWEGVSVVHGSLPGGVTHKLSLEG